MPLHFASRVKKAFETNHQAEPAWYCLRSQLKHEALAAARLRQEGFEVFLPRIRFKRASARGAVWVTEPLFPGYLFARFEWTASQRLVRHAPGVSTIVSFGPHVPTVPEDVIAALRQTVGETELHILPQEISAGETVQIVGGVLQGLSAVVTRVMPARDRVRVLLEFLGQQTSVEVEAALLVGETQARQKIL